MIDPQVRAVLGHYRLTERIGAGGMGEVYLARDSHLGRDVAIKLLPPHTFTEESARKRFRREATALSRISHPNVATIFDFDTDEDTDFLVMEYIPGASLDRMINGPLAEAEVVRLGMQIAEGLSAAHQQGVLHRDLKPGNVRVTSEGRVKILDFGLAKMLSADESDPTVSVTETKAVKGTLPYMAPEQLLGNAVDARSDIYSLGVILFELTTGRLPFAEEGSIALADSILNKTCPVPGRLNPELSARLEQIILKCLEKSPENRYGSAKELLVDLRRVASPASVEIAAPRKQRPWRRIAIFAGAIFVASLAAAIVWLLTAGGIRRHWTEASVKVESIAVLPLANLSGDPSQEYFVDGMTDELITQLSKIRSLKVISRTSVMRFKNTSTPLPEIAKQLDVDAVIEGSVMRSGNRVRINAQLLSADDRHLWADTFNRDLRDVLTLSSEVTRAIADQVRAQLTPQEKEQLAQSKPVNEEAYESFLQGQFLMQSLQYQKAIPYFETAVQKAPEFVPAWYNLAEANGMIAFMKASHGDADPTEGVAGRVMQLAPESPEAYIIRGDLEFYNDWNWDACERDFHHAVDLSPRNLQALEHYALCLSVLGKQQEAASMLERAKDVDPLSPMVYRFLGDVYERAHDPERAAACYRQSTDLAPQNTYTFVLLGHAYAAAGDAEKAQGALFEAVRLSGDTNSEEARKEEAVLRKAGLTALNRVVAQNQLKALTSGTQQPSPYHLARAYVALGQNEKAMAMLEKAYEQRIANLAWVPVNREWDPLRADPRFVELLKKMKYPQ